MYSKTTQMKLLLDELPPIHKYANLYTTPYTGDLCLRGSNRPFGIDSSLMSRLLTSSKYQHHHLHHLLHYQFDHQIHCLHHHQFHHRYQIHHLCHHKFNHYHLHNFHSHHLRTCPIHHQHKVGHHSGHTQAKFTTWSRCLSSELTCQHACLFVLVCIIPQSIIATVTINEEACELGHVSTLRFG